jgi:6-carboxyhexanoate--CoA ligase
MLSMVNIRMRASRRRVKGEEQKLKGERREKKGHFFLPLPARHVPCAPRDEVHISGAEGMYPKKQVRSIVQSYLDRAQNHPKGRPDRIIITIETLRTKPRPVCTLPVVTLKCASPAQATAHILRLLSSAGISERALDTALAIVRSKNTMRGAALVPAHGGRRVEPDKDRGIRASCLGITGGADVLLSQELEKYGINTRAVKEALVLASKVASCPDIIAELCISDDPDYTTGYVASKTLGYVRIPHIKIKGDRRGGRVFFLRKQADVPAVIRYLEKSPVIITGISKCFAESSLHELIGPDHQ